MRVVGLKVLKDKLSEYVRIAASGESVLVTDRDRVVAELTAPDPTRATQVADIQLLELMRQGTLTPPLHRTQKPPRGPRLLPVAAIVDELRTDRDAR
jgi:antitoxin (DNA-binding transcriptional repressor) of toxin-antitoxin stability system